MTSGIHFVGSIPLPDSATTFDYISKALPKGVVKRIPDGETGNRYYFVQWNRSFFPDDVLMNTLDPNGWRSFTEAEVTAKMKAFPGVNSKYDTEAVKSYKVFKQLRDRGAVAADVRFQACVPTPDNFIGANIQPDLQAPIAPLYEEALIESIRKMQREIPQQDLAIQLDMAMEFALLHNQWYKMMLGPVKYIDINARKDVLMPMLVDKVIRMAEAVDDDVELGFHFCYGDAGKRHFVEPPDTAMLSEFLLQILKRLERPLTWVHFPVPKDRTDEAYLEPFKEIVLPILDRKTEIYVGLVHADDLEGTKKRIEAARKGLGRDFGIATECGLGRRDQWEFDAVLDVKRAVVGGSKM